MPGGDVGSGTGRTHEMDADGRSHFQAIRRSGRSSDQQAEQEGDAQRPRRLAASLTLS